MPIGNPALLALLGLATIAGLRSHHRNSKTLDHPGQDQEDSVGPWTGTGFGAGFGAVPLGGLGRGFVFDLGDLLGGRPPGVVASGGLLDLMHQLQAAGYGPAAQSWVSNEPNQPLRPAELEQALDEDLLQELEQRTGLPRAEIVERLATGLPETVNQLTPEGRVPTDTEAEQTTATADSVVQPQDQEPLSPGEEQFVIGPDSVELKEPGSSR